jgi:hypothetical protein
VVVVEDRQVVGVALGERRRLGADHRVEPAGVELVERVATAQVREVLRGRVPDAGRDRQPHHLAPRRHHVDADVGDVVAVGAQDRLDALDDGFETAADPEVGLEDGEAEGAWHRAAHRRQPALRATTP